MGEFRILAENFRSINYELSDDPWKISTENREEAENIWDFRLEDAKKQGRELISNPKVRVIGIHLNNQILNLKLQPTNFKDFVGTRHILNISKTANPLSVGGITISQDDYIVLGLKANSSERGSNQIQICPSGYVDLGDLVGIGGGIERALYGELSEECGVDRMITAKPFLLIEREDMRQPMAVYMIQLNQTKEEIMEKWGSLDDKEFKELIFLENDPMQIKTFLKKHSSQIRPHAMGALESYLKLLQIKTVYCLGLDGNILDNYSLKSECAGYALKETINKFGKEMKPLEFFSEAYIKSSGKNSIDQWRDAWRVTFDTDPSEEFLEETELRFRFLLRDKLKFTKIFPEVLNFLKTLDKDEIAVVTTTVPINDLVGIVEKLDIKNYTSLFLARNGIYLKTKSGWEKIDISGLDKGEPHFNYILEKYNIKKNQLITISSTKEDMRHAQSFNLRSFALKNIFEDEKILKDEGAEIINNLKLIKTTKRSSNFTALDT